MGYDKQHVPLLEPEEGYNKLAASYQEHHALLTAWDSGLYQRFLPRNMSGMSVVDLGGGDGRVCKQFREKGLARYLIVDVSQELLALAPSWAETQHVDLNEEWELDQEFDVMLCFFTLLHVPQIDNFFEQAARYIQPGGRLIILHHLERKPYLHTVNHEKFRIKIEHHSYEEIEGAAQGRGFACDYLDLEAHGGGRSRVYCFSMSD